MDDVRQGRADDWHGSCALPLAPEPYVTLGTYHMHGTDGRRGQLMITRRMTEEHFTSLCARHGASRKGNMPTLLILLANWSCVVPHKWCRLRSTLCPTPCAQETIDVLTPAPRSRRP